jgi:hypothetical protein
MEDLLDIRRRLALPIRANDHVASWPGSSRTAAHVTVIEGVRIGQLHRVIARLGNRRQRDNSRLGAQIDLHQAVRCVAVRRDHRRILVGKYSRFVVELSDRRFELARSWVHEQLVCRGVIHDQRQAVDKPFLGNLLCLFNARGGDTVDLVRLFRLCDRVVPLATRDQGHRNRTKHHDSNCVRSLHLASSERPI